MEHIHTHKKKKKKKKKKKQVAVGVPNNNHHQKLNRANLEKGGFPLAKGHGWIRLADLGVRTQQEAAGQERKMKSIDETSKCACRRSLTQRTRDHTRTHAAIVGHPPNANLLSAVLGLGRVRKPAGVGRAGIVRGDVKGDRRHLRARLVLRVTDDRMAESQTRWCQTEGWGVGETG